MSATATTSITNSLTTGRLPRWAPWALLGGSWVVVSVIFAMISAAMDAEFNIALAIFVGTIVFDVLIYVIAYLVEGRRQATNRLVTSLVATAFIIALLPLVSLIFTVIVSGLPRFDIQFFSSSMRNVVGEGGGALHAIVGTLLITGMAALISIPVGLLTSIYLVEYGRGPLARAITFFVDVMTGIPSIVAGLFAYALFSLLFSDPGIRFGFGGSVALSLLMIPVVVRSSEEMLRIVPNELREASYALGVPKWLTILKVVIPTSIAGIATGVTLSIARVIGETAPLLIIAGFTTNMNYDLFADRMMTLPVFVYTQYANPGTDVQVYLDRAWAGALTLILIVMALNLIARLIARIFSPKLGR
ncbi:phosphate transport system permease protein [Microbacteriaceae bacterium SG_E_30_P1]|uniref:Phosphate transport system permease protein PstA n=1 Tax=Antiquaquibacter oligotrophicus TaxID=2880260 RepID=A0ABT6KJA3_9MICO|nr:phosphate ABC transporter permease PstA [Antiquaquibacter oligotrophicus]MDH6180059.1 phosphate transport system permease protein [Antiquaquibacter oligotrophicus]UDF14189.1 phosphate ABC transporter permease PstA [Antiquaquibacter oligotrophicus]